MKTVMLFLLLFVSAGVRSESIPPPVNLPVPNIPQQKPGWCWAAVAQQILQATRGPAQTPQQCVLVAIASGVRSDVCCAGIGNPNCIDRGSMRQIKYLIEKFGGRFNSLARPADPMTLYNTLSSGKAIVLHIRSGQMPSHVVVLTGMSFVPNGVGGVEPVVHINDPLAYYRQPIPFFRLIPIWIEALVVA